MELEADKGLIVKFYSRPVVNQAKSWGETVKDNENRIIAEHKGAGRPVVDDVDYIEIRIPTVAYADSIVDRPVMYCGGEVPADKSKVGGKCEREGQQLSCDVHRFWRRWQAYAAGRSQSHEGSDLKEWPGITRGQAEELAFHQVYTVEQLAAMNDSNVAGQWVALRQRARDYLQESKKQVTASELAERDRLLKAQGDELQAQKERSARLEAQVAQLVAAQEQSQKPDKGKPLTK